MLQVIITFATAVRKPTKMGETRLCPCCLHVRRPNPSSPKKSLRVGHLQGPYSFAYNMQKNGGNATERTSRASLMSLPAPYSIDRRMEAKIKTLSTGNVTQDGQPRANGTALRFQPRAGGPLAKTELHDSVDTPPWLRGVVRSSDGKL